MGLANVFQFYNSSIKTPPSPPKQVPPPNFNSTIVRLKLDFPHSKAQSLNDFNSTIVRLKRV